MLAGPQDEFEKLACDLAGLRHYDAAACCLKHAQGSRRLEEAEARKKAAVLQDDFEGAIQIRSEIQALAADVATAADVENWRSLVARGAGDSALEAAMERLQQRLEWSDDDQGQSALRVALENFKNTCPPVGAPRSPAEIPGLATRHRRAWQMSRAVEAATSTGALRVVQVLLVCFCALSNLLGTCAGNLDELAQLGMSPDEVRLAMESEEFRSFVLGLASLRRIAWRLGACAELFLPRGATGANLTGKGSAADLAQLRDLHSRAGSCSDTTKAAWARVEMLVARQKINLGGWEPQEFFESGCASGGSSLGASAAGGPVCTLCLLPAEPPGGFQSAGAQAECSAASVLWRGGLWHTQCANFWTRHGATCEILQDLDLQDPFAQR